VRSGFVALTVDLHKDLFNTLSWGFSYDTPAIWGRSVLRTGGSWRTGNVGAASAAASSSPRAFLDIHSHNMATFDMTAQSRFGATAAELTEWRSDTSVHARVAASVGRSLRVALSVFLDPGTLSGALSVDAARLSAPRQTNTPATGSVMVVVRGSSLALADYTSRTYSGTAAQATLWLSATSTHSLLAAGGGGSLRAMLTVGLVMGSSTGAFSTEASVISGTSRRSNSPMTGSVWVSVLGANMGAACKTSQARHFSSSSESTLWLSDSALALKASQGPPRQPLAYSSPTGVSRVTVITVGERAGHTQTDVFSIDPPVLRDVRNASNGPNIPYQINMTTTVTVFDSCSNATLCNASNATTAINYTFTNSSIYFAGSTIRGAHFGAAAYTLRVHAGRSVSLATFWHSDSSLTCRLRSSSGGSHKVAVTISTGHVIETASVVYSFDGPLVQPRSCFNVGHQASSQDECWGPPVVGSYSNTSITRVWVSEPLPCNNNDPGMAGRQCTSQNSPATGSVSVTVSGRAFAVVGLTTSARFLAPSAAEATVWTSDSAITAGSAAGSPLASRPLIATCGQRAASISQALSFDTLQLDVPGAVRDATTSNTPSTGSILLQILGSGLGSSDRTMHARIGKAGASAAESTVWLSETSVTFSAPAGRARRLLVSEYGGAATPDSLSSASSPVRVAAGARLGSVPQKSLIKSKRALLKSPTNTRGGCCRCWSRLAHAWALCPRPLPTRGRSR